MQKCTIHQSVAFVSNCPYWQSIAILASTERVHVLFYLLIDSNLYSDKYFLPTISMFYGIIVSIFYGDSGRHNAPHIHVRYQGKKASVSIEDGSVLAGNFPPKQLRMVQVWIDIHKEELLANWELASAGEEPFRITPLQ